MKGVIRSIAPAAEIIDIAHLVEPQGIDAGAYILWNAHRYFPAGTIFVSVVDPGVGTDRRILCVSAAGYRFLAPDNGILKFVLSAHPKAGIVDVRNRKYFLPNVSRTFHGRDIFAPVSAHLAAGVSAAKLGPRVFPGVGAESFCRIEEICAGPVKGRVLHTDHFGNIITNVLVPERPAPLVLKIGRHVIRRLAPAYGLAPKGVLFMLQGSSGLLEISISGGNAAASLRILPGTAVTIAAR